MPKKTLDTRSTLCHNVDMKVGSIKLSRLDGTKQYLGTVVKAPTSFPGTGLLLLGFPKEDGQGFDKVVSVITESGEVLDLEGYLNISAKL